MRNIFEKGIIEKAGCVDDVPELRSLSYALDFLRAGPSLYCRNVADVLGHSPRVVSMAGSLPFSSDFASLSASLGTRVTGEANNRGKVNIMLAGVTGVV